MMVTTLLKTMLLVGVLHLELQVQCARVFSLSANNEAEQCDISHTGKRVILLMIRNISSQKHSSASTANAE